MNVRLSRRLKALATKTNGVLATIGIVVAIGADALELKDKLFVCYGIRNFNEEAEKTFIKEITKDSLNAYISYKDALEKKIGEHPGECEEEEKDMKEIIAALNDSIDMVKHKPVPPPDPVEDKKPKTEAKKVIKVVYFNESEVLLGHNALALFIKNKENARVAIDFEQQLSNDLSNENISSSTSFFNNSSLKHYNSFYSANDAWMDKTKIKSHLNTYLIGTLTKEITKSSADADLSIVNLKFTGKVIDLKTKNSKPMASKAKETNYVESKALDDAYQALSTKLAKALKEFL